MPGTALCLAGGGSRGIVQSSFLQAFRDLGLNYDVLVGTSVGALNGLMVHANEYDKMYEMWQTIETKDIYRKSPLGYLNAFGPKACIYDSSPLEELINKVIDLDKLRSNKKPFYINTNNMTTGLPLTLELSDLSDKEIVQFAKASASPPVFFENVRFRGHRLCDGGISNKFGISEALKAKCDTIILMAPTKATPKEIKNILDMLLSIIDVSADNYLEREIKCINKVNEVIDMVNLILEPDFTRIKFIPIISDIRFEMGLLDFSYKKYGRQYLFEYGYNLASTTLKANF
jgi:NTE family protein